MFKRLLVPLDGSRLAESALPAAAYLAQILAIPVTLVHVLERNAPAEIHGEHHLTSRDEAYAYLDEVASRAFPTDVDVERHVHTSEVSDVALSIERHVVELNSDLVVMCTHGRSGVRDFLFGSIAQQVIALGKTPVLLIQPTINETVNNFSCRSILIPLDGNPDHEQALPLVAELARACSSSIHLVMVVPTLGTLSGEKAATARLLPGATSALLDLTQEGAEKYLQQHIAKLKEQEIAVTSEVARGDPITSIVRTQNEMNADLIALGTHGKTGTNAFWSGSLTPKIATRTNIPLLLVPV
jgi:nucleotide-binding universal stress UspA family protein